MDNAPAGSLARLAPRNRPPLYWEPRRLGDFICGAGENGRDHPDARRARPPVAPRGIATRRPIALTAIFPCNSANSGLWPTREASPNHAVRRRHSASKGGNAMARNTSAVFTAAALALIAGHGAYGQSLDAVLFGRYALSTTGQALLSDATSGACRATGLVPAALFDTEWISTAPAA